jgi:hypothetical protein
VQAFNRQQALMQAHSDSVYSTGINARTVGSRDGNRAILGRQPYIVPSAHVHTSMN